MKRIIPALLLLLTANSLFAQYKKASFFGKFGRTYEAGTQVYALGKGQGTPVGFKIGFGADQEGRQLFANWEVQYIPSYKYAYSTKDKYDNFDIQVNGTTKTVISYGYNLGYYLLKNDDADKKVNPFLTLGLNVLLTGGVRSETVTPESYNGVKQTQWVDFNTGVNGGAGCMINFSPSLGVKVQGGYSYRFMKSIYDGDSQEQYKLFGNHVYASVGLRVRIVKQ